MKKKYAQFIIVFSAIAFAFSACDKENSTPNLFSLEDDLAFGLQMKDELSSNTAEYPILSEQQYSAAYDYVDRIKNELLNSGEVSYSDVFPWEVYIIDKDVVNAFATPGGYLYFYTGLIKELENEAQFCGVMAHEMAHCARRHSTNQMTKAYGVQFLLSIILGQDPSQLAQIASELAGGLTKLAFSRNHEYEADEYAVLYMAKGSGGQDGAELASFFDILAAMEGSASRPPVFLSTHHRPKKEKKKYLSIGKIIPPRKAKNIPIDLKILRLN